MKPTPFGLSSSAIASPRGRLDTTNGWEDDLQPRPAQPAGTAIRPLPLGVDVEDWPEGANGQVFKKKSLDKVIDPNVA